MLCFFFSCDHKFNMYDEQRSIYLPFKSLWTNVIRFDNSWNGCSWKPIECCKDCLSEMFMFIYWHSHLQSICLLSSVWVQKKVNANTGNQTIRWFYMRNRCVSIVDKMPSGSNDIFLKCKKLTPLKKILLQNSVVYMMGSFVLCVSGSALPWIKDKHIRLMQ